LFPGRQIGRHRYRPLAVSLYGLRGYEEADDREGVVLLSLAAEGLHEALMADFSSAILGALLEDRWVVGVVVGVVVVGVVAGMRWGWGWGGGMHLWGEDVEER
jgi:hypothetical protein